jgi:hypothetical protein
VGGSAPLVRRCYRVHNNPVRLLERIQRARGAALACTLSLLWWPAPARAGEGATVAAETAVVYARQRVSKDEVVKSLKRGDPVVIDLALTSEEGDWCEVSAPDGARLGYIPCDQLHREPAPQSSSVLAGSSLQAAADSAGYAARLRALREPSGASPAEEYRYALHYWATLFDFSPAQREAATALADRLGVTACGQRYEALERAYPDVFEAMRAVRSPDRARLKREIEEYNTFAYPCRVKMLSLLDRFPGLLTPEQRQSKAQLATRLRDQLATERRSNENPPLIRKP